MIWRVMVIWVWRHFGVATPSPTLMRIFRPWNFRLLRGSTQKLMKAMGKGWIVIVVILFFFNAKHTCRKGSTQKEARNFGNILNTKTWRSNMFFHTHLCTETTLPEGITGVPRRGPSLRKVAREVSEQKSERQSFWIWIRWIQMETPRSTQPGKGWTVGTPQKQLGWRWCIGIYRFLYDIMEKWAQVMLVKKGTRILVDPHFGWLMLTSIRSRHHILLGNNFWEHFLQPTPVKQQEIFWRSFGRNWGWQSWALLGSVCWMLFFRSGPRILFYILFERSLVCFNLGFPMI